MSETQGRGSNWDDARIEQAAKYAHENGGSERDITAAARREFDSTVDELVDAIREKMRQLFGS